MSFLPYLCLVFLYTTHLLQEGHLCTQQISENFGQSCEQVKLVNEFVSTSTLDALLGLFLDYTAGTFWEDRN